MPRNPDVFRLDSQDPALQAFADRVRDFLNSKRIVVQRLPESRNPVEGELVLTQDGRLLYYANGAYNQLFPPIIPEEKDEVPAWMEEHQVTVEEQLQAARIPRSDWPYYGGF